MGDSGRFRRRPQIQSAATRAATGSVVNPFDVVTCQNEQNADRVPWFCIWDISASHVHARYFRVDGNARPYFSSVAPFRFDDQDSANQF